MNEQESNTSLTWPPQFESGNVFSKQCPSRTIMKHISGHWGGIILIALRIDGTHRFSELRRKLEGISEKMLSQNLKTLVNDGFVNRVSYPVVPPFVEYSLTPMGEEVADHVRTLAEWIEQNLPRIIEAQEESSETETIATA